jgi:magnesium transporter
VVDLRELVLADDQLTLGDLMAAPVVSAEQEDTQEDLAQIFAKYHYRMIPVVDPQDRLLGVIRYKDIMKELVTRAKE